MEQKVLVVDDEKAIVDILVFNLQKEGYNVITASDGEEGLNKALNENPDLIILDVMMPKLDGIGVCKQIRQKNITTPIIMVTAKADEVDKILGLELGADDYVTKPFSVRELMARVKANMRRILTEKELEKTPKNIIKSGKLEIDLDRYEVKKGNDIIELTVREFELLKFLMIQKNQVFSRESLLEKVWGYEYYGDVRTVDVTVRRLREKVEDNSNNPAYVMTKRGIGYYFKGEN
ncbi:MAG: DNA-binding response regulator [Clostridiales bacterium GWE2_32_10]|nr:MAG: DNA-binding response regulator [Clostridiales bacterium GWE2_32_10]HBY21447.1 DNA-binding response regulator [Clostridiales bacterium]